MGHPRGHSVTKAEAVGQVDIPAAFLIAKGIGKILVAVENVADQGFGRGAIDIAIFPSASGGIPTSCGYVLLDLFKFLRIIFFHQSVTVGAFPVEDVVGIVFN